VDVIEVAGLRKEYRRLRGSPRIAVDGLDFAVPEGGVFGFLGPNGAGKTTTIRCLLGLVAPTAGTCRLLGVDVGGDLHRVIGRVGVIVETPALFPTMSGRRNLELLGRLEGIGPRRVTATLERVGLAERADDLVKRYSLGMRQRLGLAAALLKDPEVLILDEPANGLDPEGVHWLRRFLRGFADQGGTVLVSSHLLAEVAQTVDEVVIITRGRLVSQASLADLTHRSQPGVRVRTPQPEALRGALTAEGIAAELVTADTLIAFQTTTEAVGLAAAGANVAIYEMTTQGLDLEELFLELTNSEEAAR
jgi:ABC-2 type transport system ATP-binding protein